MNTDIDIVLLWVDGNDPDWQKEKNLYWHGKQTAKDVARYRDWDNLQYWFRAIEKFIPWVRKIHFVTWGHVPEWLNKKHQKLNIISHKEFIPDNYLPTFNSITIEMNLHRIKGLAEHFIYFNDDMFVLNAMSPKDFFVNGTPCDAAIMNATSVVPGWEIESYIEFNNAGIINKHFNKKNILKNNLFKWINIKYGKHLFRNIVLSLWPYFTGFYTSHLPTSMKKGTYEELWSIEYRKLNDICLNKFRSLTMVNQWLVSEWQLCKGDFIPRSPQIGKTFSLSDNKKSNEKIYKVIRTQKYKLICINDYVYDESFYNTKNRVIDCFESILPEKSDFETR